MADDDRIEGTIFKVRRAHSTARGHVEGTEVVWAIWAGRL